MKAPTPLRDDEIAHLQRTYSDGGKLATLVIGVRMKEGDESRKDNLTFLLKWIRNHYGDLFDILIIEQDRAPTENFREIIPGEYRSEEHTSELQSLMRISYAVFCLKTKIT